MSGNSPLKILSRTNVIPVGFLRTQYVCKELHSLFLSPDWMKCPISNPIEDPRSILQARLQLIGATPACNYSVILRSIVLKRRQI